MTLMKTVYKEKFRVPDELYEHQDAIAQALKQEEEYKSEVQALTCAQVRSPSLDYRS